MLNITGAVQPPMNRAVNEENKRQAVLSGEIGPPGVKMDSPCGEATEIQGGYSA